MTALEPVAGALLVTPPADVDHLISDRTRERIARGRAANTITAYARQWNLFERWCETTGRTPLPATPETLAEYATHLTDAVPAPAPATIEQAIYAIRRRHRDRGWLNTPDTDAVLHVLRGYRRDRLAAGLRPKQSAPLVIADLRRILAVPDQQPRADTDGARTAVALMGARNRALAILGFAMYGRRSEITGLHLDDLTELDEGLRVFVRASKTDTQGEGATGNVPWGSAEATCPVRIVRRWRAQLADHGIREGRLFRSVDRWGNVGEALTPQAVNLIVQRMCRGAGLPGDAFTAHSLRAGAATSAFRAGAAVGAVVKDGRWSPSSSVVHGYFRQAHEWNDHSLGNVL